MNPTIRLLSRQLEILRNAVNNRDARLEALEARLRIRAYREGNLIYYKSVVVIPRFKRHRNAKPVLRNR